MPMVSVIHGQVIMKPARRPTKPHTIKRCWRAGRIYLIDGVGSWLTIRLDEIAIIAPLNTGLRNNSPPSWKLKSMGRSNRPAAAGVGKPVKYGLVGDEPSSRTLCTLKRARRM